jgi:signal transduction histidine kinase
MNERILLVGNESDGALTKAAELLETRGYLLTVHEAASGLLAEHRKGSHDLILLRPDGRGAELVSLIRGLDPETPLVCLVGTDEAEAGIGLVRQGADDFIAWPDHPEALLVKLEQNLHAARLRRHAARLEYEKNLMEMEINQLLSWRAMYAAKDTTQTEQLINVITRTVNADGGYMWLNLLTSLATPSGDKHQVLPNDLINLIMDSTRHQKRMFDFLTFLCRLESLELDSTPRPVAVFAADAGRLFENQLDRLCPLYQRPWSCTPLGASPEGSVAIDLSTLGMIVSELIVNAIKYSPPGTPLSACIEYEEIHHSSQLKISLANQPRELQARHADGSRIIGIPYDYAERVFDLFYTIDAYPNRLPEEEWSDGAGLYISRKLLKRQNAWLKTASGTDYSGGTGTPFVRFTITVPVKKNLSGCA